MVHIANFQMPTRLWAVLFLYSTVSAFMLVWVDLLGDKVGPPLDMIATLCVFTFLIFMSAVAGANLSFNPKVKRRPADS